LGELHIDCTIDPNVITLYNKKFKLALEHGIAEDLRACVTSTRERKISYSNEELENDMKKRGFSSFFF